MQKSDHVALADEIYSMTEALVLTGKPDLMEKEINDYSELTDRREPLIRRLVEYMESGGAGEDERAELKLRVKKINDLDKEHFNVMKHIQASVKESLKWVRSGRKLSNAYVPLVAADTPAILDARQ